MAAREWGKRLWRGLVWRLWRFGDGLRYAVGLGPIEGEVECPYCDRRHEATIR